MAAPRDEIVAWLDDELEIERFRDYGPNGLQVVGSPTVTRVAVAVSSTLEAFEAAAAWGADLLVVHHGLFLDGRSMRVDAVLRRRLEVLFAADMSLAGYHLPLDAHPTLGNNARLAADLGLLVEGRFAESRGAPLAVYGSFPSPLPVARLVEQVEAVTGRAPIVFSGGPDPVRSLGVCSGGAGGFVAEAAALPVDAYLTGEPEEDSRAMAHELGITYLAGGHHATETLGVRALARVLGERYDVETTFVDSANPV
jgi:dinuclear metal center YbgI/SA1388 family protein